MSTHARTLCRETAAGLLADGDGEGAAAKIATSVASAKTVAAVVNLARADARHATAPEDWDADAWALNTPGGMVVLRTGRMRPHDRAAHQSVTMLGCLDAAAAAVDALEEGAFLLMLLVRNGSAMRPLLRSRGASRR